MVSGRPVARFQLVDQDGLAVSDDDFNGTFLLVYFGFTHCRVVCPRSLDKLSRALEELGDDASRIRALYITVDPTRDTPEVMRAYLRERYPRFTGLTGTQAQIDAAKQSFRVFAERKPDAEDPDGYSVPHSAISYLMSPDGSYCTHFTDAIDTKELAGRIERVLQEQRTS